MKVHSNTLIQIVPSLPPAIDGIGDYAVQLARQLREHCGIESSFIVCDPDWPRDRWTGEFQAVGLGKRSESMMRKALDLLSSHKPCADGPILLHFSPYGYETRGCPLWLVRALELTHKKVPGRINIAFHELDVHSSPLLSSAYWVPALQRWLMRRLLRLGTFNYTNTDLHRLKLETWGKRSVAFIPNFSNIGELPSSPLMHDRARHLVIFGRADQRRWTYKHGSEALALVCAHIKAACIIDVGATIPEHTCADINGVPVERLGILAADEVAAVMRSAFASFMYYPIPLLTKSGVHALSCASGTLSFVINDKEAEAACRGLVAGVDYIAINASESLPPIEMLERLAPAIYASYCKRTSKVAARTIADHLLRNANSEPDAKGFLHDELAAATLIESVSMRSFTEQQSAEVAL